VRPHPVVLRLANVTFLDGRQLLGSIERSAHRKLLRREAYCETRLPTTRNQIAQRILNSLQGLFTSTEPVLGNLRRVVEKALIFKADLLFQQQHYQLRFIPHGSSLDGNTRIMTTATEGSAAADLTVKLCLTPALLSVEQNGNHLYNNLQGALRPRLTDNVVAGPPRANFVVIKAAEALFEEAGGRP
jgi:hypothetical protein